MKSTYKYILSALLVAGSLVACSPDDIEGLNESGVPQASNFEDMVEITVDQSTNQVTFNLKNAKGVYPVWNIDTGKKIERSTVNGYQRIFASSGDYTVNVQIGSRDGISDGVVTRTFHIDNTIMDFTKYTTMLSKAPWYIDNKTQGHLACGESVGNPTNWWAAQPDDKAGTGLYDNSLEFTEDYRYTFNPGKNGTMYVNYGTTALNTIGATEDFSMPVEAMSTSYAFEVEGDDLFLTFPAKTYFPYIANDAIWENPRYLVVNMTTKSMTLVSEGPGIAWQYILTTTHETVFEGFDYTSPDNIWKQANPVFNTIWYAPGWSQIADFPYEFDANSVKVTLPEATTDQWMAQFSLHTSLDNNIVPAGQTYDFSCVITSTQDHPGITVKLVQTGEGNDGNFICADRVKVGAMEDYIYYFYDVPGIDLGGLTYDLFLDFGGNAAGTEVTIKNFCFIEHSKNTIVPPSDEPGPEPGQDVDWSGANILEGMPVELQYYYAPGWAQIDNPECEINGTAYTWSLPAATTDQWQAQAGFHNTGITLSKDLTYDFRCKIVSNTDHPGVTVKITQEDDDNIFITADRHAVTAYEETWVTLPNLAMIANGTDMRDITNMKIVLDFGGNADGTVITISDMHLQEHKGPKAIDWDLTGDRNLWLKGAHQTLSFYYAPGWAQIADPETVVEGNSYTIVLPEATSDQWQAQWHISTELGKADISADKKYNIRFTLFANQDQPGVTVKFTENGNDDNYLTADRHACVAYEETVVELTDLALSKGDITNETFKMVFDFAGNPAGSEVTIKDIIIQEAE